MNLSVITMGGERIADVVVEAELWGSALKRQIRMVEGTPELLQQLICHEHQINDTQSLVDQGVDGSYPVVLVRRQWDVVEDESAELSVQRYGRKYSAQQHFFWAVHEGNWPACIGLSRRPDVSVDAEMLPTDFEDARNEHEWPYCVFDGRYEDRALHLAARASDICTVAALLRCKADPNLQNDNRETALDIALGRGERWDHAFLVPHNFGGNRERIVSLLKMSESPTDPELLIPPTLLSTDASHLLGDEEARPESSEESED